MSDGLDRLRAAQRVIQHAVATPEAADIGAARETGWAELGVDPRDAKALQAVTPNGDVRRIAVYRRLVRHTLRDVLQNEIPRTVARLGDDAFERYTERYFESELPRSQVLRDVAYEFAAWATPLWQEDEAIAPFLSDVMRWELLEFDVYTARARLEVEHYPAELMEELGAENGVAFDGSMRLGRFAWRVHELGESDGEPAEGAALLLAYRDGRGTFRQMTLTPIAFGMLRALWSEGATLAAALRNACEALDHAVDQQVVDGAGVVLADLAERGVVLGAHPAQNPPAPSPYARWLMGGSR